MVCFFHLVVLEKFAVFLPLGLAHLLPDQCLIHHAVVIAHQVVLSVQQVVHQFLLVLLQVVVAVLQLVVVFIYCRSTSCFFHYPVDIVSAFVCEGVLWYVRLH